MRPVAEWRRFRPVNAIRPGPWPGPDSPRAGAVMRSRIRPVPSNIDSSAFRKTRQRGCARRGAILVDENGDAGPTPGAAPRDCCARRLAPHGEGRAFLDARNVGGLDLKRFRSPRCAGIGVDPVTQTSRSAPPRIIIWAAYWSIEPDGFVDGLGRAGAAAPAAWRKPACQQLAARSGGVRRLGRADIAAISVAPRRKPAPGPGPTSDPAAVADLSRAASVCARRAARAAARALLPSALAGRKRSASSPDDRDAACTRESRSDMREPIFPARLPCGRSTLRIHQH